MTAKELSEKAAQEMNDAKKFIAKRVAKKMRNKLIQVYDTCIDQFYEFENRIYLRHDLSDNQQGTGVGVNLYRANDTMGEPPRLGIDAHTINGGLNFHENDLSPYKYNTKAEVLDYILHGIRYPEYTKRFSRIGNKTFEAMMFTVEYSDSVVSCTGTPIEVLECVRDAYIDVFTEQAKKEARKELDLQYIKIT